MLYPSRILMTRGRNFGEFDIVSEMIFTQEKNVYTVKPMVIRSDYSTRYWIFAIIYLYSVIWKFYKNIAIEFFESLLSKTPISRSDYQRW